MNSLSSHDVTLLYNDAETAWQMLWYNRGIEESEVSGLPLEPLRRQLEAAKQDIDSDFEKLKSLLDRVATVRKEKMKGEVLDSVNESVDVFKRKKEVLKIQLLVFNLVKRTCDGYMEMESVWQKISESLSKGGREESVIQRCRLRQFSSPKEAYEATAAAFEKLKSLVQKILQFSAEPPRFEELHLAENLTLRFSERREFLFQILSVAS